MTHHHNCRSHCTKKITYFGQCDLPLTITHPGKYILKENIFWDRESRTDHFAIIIRDQTDVVIDGCNFSLTLLTGSSYAIDVTDSKNVTIKDLSIVGDLKTFPSQGEEYRGIIINNSTFITMTNINISNALGGRALDCQNVTCKSMSLNNNLVFFFGYTFRNVKNLTINDYDQYNNYLSIEGCHSVLLDNFNSTMNTDEQIHLEVTDQPFVELTNPSTSVICKNIKMTALSENVIINPFYCDGLLIIGSIKNVKFQDMIINFPITAQFEVAGIINIEEDPPTSPPKIDNDTNNVSFENCQVTLGGSEGLNVGLWNSAPIFGLFENKHTGWHLKNCQFSDALTGLFLNSGENFVIEDCRAERCNVGMGVGGTKVKNGILRDNTAICCETGFDDSAAIFIGGPGAENMLYNNNTSLSCTKGFNITQPSSVQLNSTIINNGKQQLLVNLTEKTKTVNLAKKKVQSYNYQF